MSLIDCQGKPNIPVFQRVLNHFQIPYTAVYDEDRGNRVAVGINARITQLLTEGVHENRQYVLGPTDLEGLLDYEAKSDKVYRGVRRVEEIHRDGHFSQPLVEALNWIYFGQLIEPNG